MDIHVGNTNLYPAIEPFDFGMLDVGSGHSIYWEQSGNPSGVPVLFLHGGPGSGSSPIHRQFFDPDHYRIILFDQRGAGRSLPYAEIADNSTHDLVEDIEALRRSLGIEQWMAFGGSWGATMALVYAIEYPYRCLALTLRGVFLGRSQEIDWFLYGMRRVFPEAWEAFAGYLPEDERGDLLAGYHRRLIDPNPDVHGPAAGYWNRFETDCSTLHRKSLSSHSPTGVGTLSLARIEAHYFINGCFFSDEYILESIKKLQPIPTVVVQGRYDMICPPAAAYDLVRSFPHAKMVMVPDAGHSAMEPGIRGELVRAMDNLRSLPGDRF